AETYQSRGALDKAGYSSAILGGQPGKDGKNIIWGWALMAKMTQDNDKFDDTFHLARHNLAECRYLYGMKQTDPEKQKKFAQAAKDDIRITYKLYPNMGGKES